MNDSMALGNWYCKSQDACVMMDWWSNECCLIPEISKIPGVYYLGNNQPVMGIEFMESPEVYIMHCVMLYYNSGERLECLPV